MVSSVGFVIRVSVVGFGPGLSGLGSVVEVVKVVLSSVGEKSPCVVGIFKIESVVKVVVDGIEVIGSLRWFCGYMVKKEGFGGTVVW